MGGCNHTTSCSTQNLNRWSPTLMGVKLGPLCATNPAALELCRIYAAPEVCRGAPADERSDVYGLGRILHFALLGEDASLTDEELPRLDALLKQHPSALVRIIRKCTVRNPAQRYASGAEIVDDLDRAARHLPAGLAHPDIDGSEESSMLTDAEFLASGPPEFET